MIAIAVFGSGVSSTVKYGFEGVPAPWFDQVVNPLLKVDKKLPR